MWRSAAASLSTPNPSASGLISRPRPTISALTESSFHGIRPRHLCPTRSSSSCCSLSSTSHRSPVVMMAKREQEMKEIVDLKGELGSMRKRKRKGNGLSRAPNFVAYYGLKSPPYKLKQKGNGLSQAPNVVAYYGLKSPPYKLDALEPYMSKRTLEIHWGEHHRGYVETLNKHLGRNDVLYGYTLDELVKVTYNNGNPMPEFNDAAQVWNHDFFWESMQPGGEDSPKLGLLQQIDKDFGSFANFKEKFAEAALTLFGSGWVWLVLKRKDKRLEVVKTVNAICPIVWDDIPIICLDMWEHAYYLDFRNDKAEYVNTFMNHLVSWHAATARIARAQAFVNLGEPKIPVA